MFLKYNLPIALTVCLILAVAIFAGAQTQQTANAPETLEVRGQVVDLAARMQQLYDASLAREHHPLQGFETTDSQFYTLLRTVLSEALFVDKRLHERDLIIKGRVFPQTHILEVITVQSVHDGVVHEVYYYCTTCAIRSVAPGNCECCGEPVELVERPLTLEAWRIPGN